MATLDRIAKALGITQVILDARRVNPGVTSATHVGDVPDGVQVVRADEGAGDPADE